MTFRLARAAGMAVLMLASVDPAFPQGLADTAKKEQARRKKTAPTGAAKVYTESDLPASPPTSTSSSVSAPQTPAPSKNAPTSAATEERRRQQIAALEMQEAEIGELVARAEAEVARFANHPTGGGKVCRIPEGVYKPGETAPSSVVCPYQMESRYDRAKRELDAAKAELAKFQEIARQAGMRN